MAAARVALALALVVSAVQTGGAEPCAPRAELGGDAEAVAKVAAELQRLGVDASTDPMKRPARNSCPVIVAAVELDRGGGIAVAVRDSSQRSEGRVVSDAALAAAWIDSWLRDDFTAPPAPEVAPLAPPSTVDATPAPVTTPLLDRFSLAASYLLSWSDDSTSWSGFGASLCVRAGGWCIGGRVGYENQTVTADLTAAAKSDLSLLATASYPRELGTMSIAPEFGVGVGRVATSRLDGCKVMDPNCDPMTDPTCMTMPPQPCTTADGTVYVGDNFSTATYTPRLQAALRIAVPLFDHVWLDGLAAATAAPFGHTDEYAPIAPGGTTMTNGAAYPLPGDPMLGIQLGIGLRVGAQ